MEKYIAIFHDGKYHYDSTPFIPQVDQIVCDLNDSYDSLLSRYRKQFGDKANDVAGVFIVKEQSFRKLTTKDAATVWLEGTKAASQNTHQLRCCASGSTRILGKLPNSDIEYTDSISKYRELCDKADAMFDIIQDIKRNKS